MSCAWDWDLAEYHHPCGKEKQTILATKFWNFTMFWYMSNYLQVKQNLTSSAKNLGYELPRELLNEIELRILKNLEMLEAHQIWVEIHPTAQYSFQKLKFGKSSQNVRKIRYQNFLVRNNSNSYILVKIFWVGLQIWFVWTWLCKKINIYACWFNYACS